MTTSGGAAGFTNAGLLDKPNDSADAATIAVPYNSVPGGVTESDAGVLALADGGSNSGGTYIAGAGNTIDLTGGTAPSFSGVFTGSGAGTVSFASGELLIVGTTDLNGATFNFPGNLFQWTGGTIDGTGGHTLTNSGHITINGSLENLVDAATLTNVGTIAHVAGELRTNNSVIVNASAGVYDFQNAAAASITTSGGAAGSSNFGTVRKSTGATSATIAVPYDNTGTTEVDTAGLSLTSSVAQHTTPTLTAGTWNILDGTLSDAGPAITTNNANILLGSATASWASVASSLMVNNGSFALTNGATLTTPGGFTSPGTLSLGTSASAGGKLVVTGSLSQTGTYAGQVGGAPDSNAVGTITASAVTLSGTLSVYRLPDFAPSTGASYVLISNTGASPVSGTFTGLGEGATFTFDFVDYRISYAGGDGNDVVITALATHPHLEVTVSDPSGATHQAGSGATVSLAIVNNGATVIPAGAANIYLSPAAAFNSQADYLIGVANVPGVGLNQSATFTPDVTVPAIAPAGNYFLTAVLDSGNGDQAVTSSDRVFSVGAAAFVDFSLDDLFPTSPLVVGQSRDGNGRRFQRRKLGRVGGCEYLFQPGQRRRKSRRHPRRPSRRNTDRGRRVAHHARISNNPNPLGPPRGNISPRRRDRSRQRGDRIERVEQFFADDRLIRRERSHSPGAIAGRLGSRSSA